MKTSSLYLWLMATLGLLTVGCTHVVEGPRDYHPAPAPPPREDRPRVSVRVEEPAPVVIPQKPGGSSPYDTPARPPRSPYDR